MSYYSDKVALLSEIFGTSDIDVGESHLRVGERRYSIVDDVIILLPENMRPKGKLHPTSKASAVDGQFAADIQYTFGAEWQRYPVVLPEHRAEFDCYFDIVDRQNLAGKRICDLGCGIGRWSYFLQDVANELVLVDFSEAIFVARQNLRGFPKAVFFQADLTRLPFRESFCDFLFCLGVLHHLENDALGEVRKLKRFAPEILIYLYSALDNRPLHYRLMLPAVNALRLALAKVEKPMARDILTEVCMWTIYLPLIGLGWLLRPLGLHTRVPLFDFYHDKSLRRIRQDVYDRFFTRIEQRVSRAEIRTLGDTFASVTISEQIPMWHFLCQR